MTPETLIARFFDRTSSNFAHYTAWVIPNFAVCELCCTALLTLFEKCGEGLFVYIAPKPTQGEPMRRKMLAE